MQWGVRFLRLLGRVRFSGDEVCWLDSFLELCSVRGHGLSGHLSCALLGVEEF